MKRKLPPKAKRKILLRKLNKKHKKSPALQGFFLAIPFKKMYYIKVILIIKRGKICLKQFIL